MKLSTVTMETWAYTMDFRAIDIFIDSARIKAWLLVCSLSCRRLRLASG